MGMPSRVVPSTADDGTMRGSTVRGMPKAPSSTGSQSSVAKFMSCVRLAFVTSVACRPVRFQSTQVSIVPNNRSPFSALARAPGTLSNSHRSFNAEK